MVDTSILQVHAREVSARFVLPLRRLGSGGGKYIVLVRELHEVLVYSRWRKNLLIYDVQRNREHHSKCFSAQSFIKSE